MNLLTRWQQEWHFSHTAELTRRAIYLVALVNFIHLVPIGDLLWGYKHFIILRDQYEGIGAAAMLLNHENWRLYYGWFLWPEIALLALGAAGVAPWWLRVPTWYLFVVLHFGNVEVSNGGWHILHHSLFFMLFIPSGPVAESSWWIPFYKLAANLAFRSIWLLICLMYAVAGIHKLTGEHWPSGDALFLISQFPEYTTNLVPPLANSWWLKLLTWATLGYQLVFPVLIWIRRLRPPLLLVGVVFHLGIAVLVGVADFGFMLMAAYVAFMPDERAQRVLELLSVQRWRSQLAAKSSNSGKGD